tara:strand:+ start:1145 stop:1345 length:201 start_codon:yes stop_codon:yes gene_type:complete
MINGDNMSRIEEAVCKKIMTRADIGKAKYGVTMEKEELTRKQWLIHAQEEAMDLAIYLQKLIEMED